MATIIEMTMFLAIALLAVVVTVFVLAASLLGRAIEEARDQQKKAKMEEEEELTKIIRDMQEKLEQTKASDDMKRLKKDISGFEKKRRSLQKNSRLAMTRYELLTARGSVLYPGLLFIGAMALDGVARYYVDVPHHHWTLSPHVLWAVSLILLFSGCWFVYSSLRVIESLAISTEEVQSKRLMQALQTALDQHEKAKLPELRLKFREKEPPYKFQSGSEEIIKVGVELVRGDVARKAELWFGGPKAFDFPGRMTIPKGNEHHEVRMEYKADLKKPLVWVQDIRLKSPPAKGTFKFEYMVLCEGFASSWREFVVEVV
jgi:hypothetical protein